LSEENIGIPFLVINLDSQIERWENCLAQAGKFGLRLFRISAVTPAELSEMSSHYVTTGVRAVWESHMECMKYLLNTKASHALILEDDFKFLNFERIRHCLENSAVLNYDLVQFGFLKPGVDTRVKIFVANMETVIFRSIALLSQFRIFSRGEIQNRLRVKEAREMPRGFTADDFQPGAHCYLVSREMAKAVLELNNPQFLCIDDFFTAFSQMRSFKSMRSRKSLVGQAPFAKWEGDRFLKTPQ
jgi:GR25 family glycosyltransferase involved in LPS biosynthesis